MRSLLGVILALSAAIIPAITVTAATPVDLTLVTAEQNIHAGDTFEVVIQVQSGDQQVIGIDAYLNFDPSQLAVVDMNSGQAGSQIAGGTTLSIPLWNSANNSIGHIDYCAGAFKPYPKGTFSLATIRFLALAATSPTTSVTFSTSFERPTMVIGDTQTNTTGTLSGGTYIIKPAVTTPIPSGGGSSGGGGENRLDTSGFSAETTLTTNSNGLAQNSARLTTADGQAALDIAAGTSLLSDTGKPLSKLTAEALDSPPATPTGDALILAYTLGPSGATFKPDIMLTLRYDPANLPAGVAEMELKIAYYDGATWRELASTVDPLSRTVSARISHFSVYAVIGKTRAESSPAFSASATPPVTPSDSELPPGGDTAGLDQAEITPTTIGNQNEGPTSEQDTAAMTPAITPASSPTPQSKRGGWLIITSIMFTLVLVIILTDVIRSRKRPNREA